MKQNESKCYTAVEHHSTAILSDLDTYFVHPSGM